MNQYNILKVLMYCSIIGNFLRPSFGLLFASFLATLLIVYIFLATLLSANLTFKEQKFDSTPIISFQPFIMHSALCRTHTKK